MADETLTVAERVAKHFPEWLKVRDQVYDKDGDLIVPTDDNTVVIVWSIIQHTLKSKFFPDHFTTLF